MSTFSLIDHTMMAKAIRLAEQGRYTTSPNPNVGCVIVKEGEVVGEGFHQKAGHPHAEVYALNMAKDAAKGATAYVTLEPCSHQGRTGPCCDALIRAGIARVVIAMTDTNPQVSGQGIARLKAAGIDVALGLMAEQARALNVGFFKRMEQKRPFVRVKLAATLDGKTALSNGASKWITGKEARADVQHLRAEACVVLTGADTVLSDDAKLNVRPQSLPFPLPKTDFALRQPIRAVIDSQHRLSPNTAFVKVTSPIWVFTTTPSRRQWPAHVTEVVLHKAPNGKVCLKAVLTYLAEHECNQVLVEAGQHLAGAMIEQNLADELVLYFAPKLFGSDAKGLCAFGGLTQVAEAPHLTIKDVRHIGTDVRLTATFKTPS